MTVGRFFNEAAALAIRSASNIGGAGTLAAGIGGGGGGGSGGGALNIAAGG